MQAIAEFDNEKETLRLLLNNYIERKQEFAILNDYDSSMQSLRSEYAIKMSTLIDPLKSIAEKLFEISDKSHFLFIVIEWKIDHIVSALIHAIDTQNPISLANNARALLEHVSSIVGLGKELMKLEKN